VNLAGIILAAGESKRMGRSKAFLPFRGGTFLSALADTFGAYCSPVIAVFGFAADEAVRRAPAGVVPVVNRAYRDGMLTSLQAGLNALDLRSLDRVLFTLVDHPAVSADTIQRMLRSEAEIAIPMYGGRRGHPVLISASVAFEYLKEPPHGVVRDTIDRCSDRIEYIEVNDPGIHDDVDDPALYQALLAREGAGL
jgi:CTP:molybdopterin cytidylyltransferase MocA